MRIAYHNPGDTARALASAWKQRGGPSHARPYNYFEADQSTWWAIPSADWPAYRHGKILISHNGDWVPSGKLFAGFSVEKGLGAGPAAAGYCKSDLVMDKTWLWHRFLGDLGGGRFGEAVDQASASVGERLRLIVLAQPVVIGFKGRRDRDHVHFEAQAGSALSLVHYDRRQGTLAGAAQVHDLAGLAASIRQLPDSEWTWIDLCAGSFFDPPGNEVSEALHAADIWRKLAEPFALWLI